MTDVLTTSRLALRPFAPADAFAFGRLALEQIAAGHFIDNPASGRVLTKLGFRYIGKGRRESVARGHAVESLDMRLKREDWTRP